MLMEGSWGSWVGKGGRVGKEPGTAHGEGRSSKHALSWQTLSWSWRAGWAPGGCLCASDGRGADYHQHSACHRVLRGGEKGKKADTSRGSKIREKESVTTSPRHLEKHRRGRRRSTSSTPHPVVNPPYLPYPPLRAIPLVWTALPPYQEDHGHS